MGAIKFYFLEMYDREGKTVSFSRYQTREEARNDIDTMLKRCGYLIGDIGSIKSGYCLEDKLCYDQVELKNLYTKHTPDYLDTDMG